MKAIPVLLGLILFLGLMAVGNGRAMAESAKQKAACNLQFSQLDSGQKGYLTRQDFDRGWSGPLGNRNMGPYGNPQSGFAAADKNANGRLSPGEYCDWMSHA